MGAPASAATTDVVRVMVVDDSVVARSLTSKWLQEQPGIEVVATCRSGMEAIAALARVKADVAVLDVEMPGMDGVEALPLMLRARPSLAVLMNSSFTTRGADLSLRCIALGATDVLAKPARDGAHTEDYRRELIAKIKTLGDVARRRAGAASRVSSGAASLAMHAGVRRVGVAAATEASRVRAVVIGASTGGPQALMEVLGPLQGVLRDAPVLIAQHMPAGFTAALGQHLSAASGIEAREAKDGEQIVGGVAYVAPGGRHLSVAVSGARILARVEDGPPINFCKPSLDPLFRSAAHVYGSGLLAVVLTGMGSDGASAVPVVVEAGGRVIAQDEASSVVWGMPGAAAATGLCSAILPLKQIGPRIGRLIEGGRS